MRRTTDVTITLPGRDNGATFHLTEMPAWQGERWAIRALLAIAHSGVDIPDDVANAGWQGIALFFQSDPRVLLKALMGIDFAEAEPLLDEMMGCVQRREETVIRSLTPDDIQEVATRLFLRGEVLKLHVDFSQAGAPLASSQTAGPTPSSTTQTSPQPSGPRSRAALRR